MPLHTTNYFSTFIEVAEDTKATAGTIPPEKGNKKTVAQLQYELIANHPYKYTSDEVLFLVYAERNDLSEAERQEAKEEFFSKGQACLIASPLPKTMGLVCITTAREEWLFMEWTPPSTQPIWPIRI